jgi:class 3 adenylate cyclase
LTAKATGDGLLVEFASVIDAARCAVEVQQTIPEGNAGVAADNPSIQRIGFHSLLNVRSRTATKTRLTSHIAIRRG